jgi:2-keto-4-pentenoate hydratase/2-oxohepta-3-ene-1,7-dioic acid hydratase in catechol pathway
MHEVTLKPSKRFSVGKIVCVGKNYDKHIKEMHSDRPESPVLFLKPSTAIVEEGTPINLPVYSNDVHHEIELALLVNKRAQAISPSDWKKYIGGAGIALDLTLRDHQQIAKDQGLPWSVSKGFDGSCPVSQFTPIDQMSELQSLDIELKVNGDLRQKGSTEEMIFKIDELIAHISGIFTLEPGDLILTGTPAGVSRLHHGDHLEASIENIGTTIFDVK